MPANNSNPENWSAEDKLAVVIETAALNEAQLSEYCRSKLLRIPAPAAYRTSCT